MRLLTFLLLVIVLLASCGDRNVPSDIIPIEKMQTIMWQMMQSDGYVNNLLAKDSTKKSSVERMKRYQEIFELNKSSMAEFKKSYAYYVSHPDVAKAMFDSMGVRASRQRANFYKPVDSASGAAAMKRLQAEKQKADSIAKSGKPQTIIPSPAIHTAEEAKARMLHLEMEKKRADSLAKVNNQQQHVNSIPPAVPADARANMLRFQLERRKADSLKKAGVHKTGSVKQ